jgi:hypothetical protein
MTHQFRRNLLVWSAAAGVAVATLIAYRAVLPRPFAADDYQWLLAVRGLSGDAVLRAAFDTGQSHFYRPLVWLLFWAEERAFGLDPRGYHVVSLGLHLLCAALLGGLAWRLAPRGRAVAAVVAGAIVALHPATFEAVVWVAAQSEVLAAALLLAALLLWRVALRATLRSGGAPRAWALAACLALGLALLAKESAAAGLPLLALLTWAARPAGAPRQRAWALLALPLLLTFGYLALALGVERRNYLVETGGYGVGPQLVRNPLIGLGLIVAPLPGTQHADAAWLPWAGTAVGLGLLALLARGGRGARAGVLALLVTLLPTAPFASPPDSRYLYLPVAAAALLAGLGAGRLAARRPRGRARPAALAVGLALAALLLLATGRELAAREARFAADAGPGGSLWRLAAQVCAEAPPRRLIVVEPPLAPPHAEAAVQLACGPGVRPLILGRGEVEAALRPGSVVIAFPNGSAAVERRV